MAMVTVAIAASSGRSLAQADWFGTPDAVRYIHQMNRMNSRTGCAMTTAP